jgi:hypothetical protein
LVRSLLAPKPMTLSETSTGTHARRSDLQNGAVARSGTVKRRHSVYGRQLAIAGANGGYSHVALFYRNKCLYQVEGDALVAGGRRRLRRCDFNSRSISRSARWTVADSAYGAHVMSAPGGSRRGGMKGLYRF